MEVTDLKQIVLNDKHIALGAKMVSFAGFSMPVQYAGVIEEHNCVRNGVGMFDVSHMGEFSIKGSKALDLIQYITTNDASKLENGGAQYSCFPNGKGGIIDDLLVYKFADNDYMLVVNGANIDKDWAWVSKHNEKFGAEITNLSLAISLLAVQGPKAADALQSLTNVDMKAMKYYTFEVGTFAGVNNVIISATGYTGSGGFEIYVDNQHTEKVFEAIMQAGKPFGLMPIGLAARDTLRLEMGFCLYGNDINDETSPLEAGLGWITKLGKDSDFVDKEFITNLKEKGVAKKLVAFEMIDRGIPRQHYEICDANEHIIGEVTSGTQSPSMNKGIGMGYVAKEFSALDTAIYVKVRNKLLKANIVKLPFYK